MRRGHQSVRFTSVGSSPRRHARCSRIMDDGQGDAIIASAMDALRDIQRTPDTNWQF
jgi:hypothetical protein